MNGLQRPTAASQEHQLGISSTCTAYLQRWGAHLQQACTESSSREGLHAAQTEQHMFSRQGLLAANLPSLTAKGSSASWPNTARSATRLITKAAMVCSLSANHWAAAMPAYRPFAHVNVHAYTTATSNSNRNSKMGDTSPTRCFSGCMQ